MIKDHLKTYASRWEVLLSWSVFWTFFAVQLMAISKNAVDIPYWDAWEVYRHPDLKTVGMDWLWLWDQHNEHRIVFTKLIYFVFLRYFVLNHAVIIVINFLLYTATILLFFRLFSRMFEARWVPLSAAILFSPLLSENLLWCFQNQFHLCILFFLLGLQALLSTGRMKYFAFLFLTMGAYSFSSGVVLAIMTALSAMVFGILWAEKRKLYLSQSALTLALVATWFIRFHFVGGPGTLALPNKAVYWEHFLNLLGLTFGITRLSIIPGLSLLVLVGIGTLLFWIPSHRLKKADSPRSQIDPQEARQHLARCFFLTSFIAGMMATLAVISVGRSQFSPGQAKASRYAEFAAFLFPFAVLLLDTILRALSRQRWQLGFAGWLVVIVLVAATGRDQYTFQLYGAIREQRLAGQRCVDAYLQKTGDGICPMIYPGPLGSCIDNAVRIGAPFTRAAKRSCPS